GDRAAQFRLAATGKAQADSGQAQAEQGKGAGLRNLAISRAAIGVASVTKCVPMAGQVQAPTAEPENAEGRSIWARAGELEAPCGIQDVARENQIARSAHGIPTGAGD